MLFFIVTMYQNVSLITMGMSENGLYPQLYPFSRDNDHENHWVQWGTNYFQTNPYVIVYCVPFSPVNACKPPAQNLDFGVDCDSRVAIVGPNGAGGAK